MTPPTRPIVLTLATCLVFLIAIVGVVRAVTAFSVLGRANLTSQGDQGAHVSPETLQGPTITSNNRWVVFGSNASNLVPNDTNGAQDVFVRDLELGTTVRVDVATDGTEPFGASGGISPSISNNGRWVVFQALSNELSGTDTNHDHICDVGDCDTNDANDVFLRDRDTDGNGILDEPGGVATTRVSLMSTGQEAFSGGGAPWISGDGRWIAFVSQSFLLPTDNNHVNDVYVVNRATGALTLISVATDGTLANGPSGVFDFGAAIAPVMSDDGRFVVFGSEATNLVSGDTNGQRDVFLRDRDTDQDGIFDEPGAVATTRISLNASGQQMSNPALSDTNGFGSVVSISGDGRFIAWTSSSTQTGIPGGNTHGSDIYVTDRVTGTLQRFGIDSATSCDNLIGRHAFKFDGSRLTFTAQHQQHIGGGATPICVNNVVVAERQGGATQQVTAMGDPPSNGFVGSFFSALSDSGAALVFLSTADTLVQNDTNTSPDVFFAGEAPLTFPTPTATVATTNPTPTLTGAGGPTPTPRPTPATLDHFVSYGVKASKGSPAFFALGPVALLAGNHYDVLKVATLLLPADKNGEGRHDQNTHLLEYSVKPEKDVPKFATVSDVHVLNQCNDLFVQVSKPVSLLVPTAKDLSNPVSAPVEANHQRDHFLCFKVKAETKRATGAALPKFPKGIQVDAEDQFQTRRYDLTKLSKLCLPTDKSGTPNFLKGPDKGKPATITPAAIRHGSEYLLCYKAKLATTSIPQLGCGPAVPGAKGTKITPKQPKHTPRTGMFIANQLGTLRLDSTKEVEFCVPSLVELPAM